MFRRHWGPFILTVGLDKSARKRDTEVPVRKLFFYRPKQLIWDGNMLHLIMNSNFDNYILDIIGTKTKKKLNYTKKQTYLHR